MTAAAGSAKGAATGPVGAAALRPSALAQTIAMSRRSMLGQIRQLPLLVPSMLFPLMFTAINSASFERSLPLLRRTYPNLTGFLTFTLAAAVIQGVLFGSINGATDLAVDIEQGFFERLLAAPAWRLSIVIGRLAGAVMLGFMQAAFFTAVLVLFGARIAAGIPGALVLVLSGALVSLAFGSLLAALAIKTGSSEAVQGLFPILFILMFTSSCFFPRQTMRGWFKKVADVNPISHLVEALRELIINEFSWSAATRALLIPVAIFGVSLALALMALRSRLAAR